MRPTTSKRRVTVATATLLTALITGSCSPEPPGPQPDRTTTPAQPAVPPPEPSPTPESVGANELGDVPVLMYHRITESPSSVYGRTPQEFRAELERLADEGYTPITATEFATGRIDIPAGRHPVVLTFDDGSATQFGLDESGSPKPGTAVHIMLEVAREHPEFQPVATFYVFDPPFEEPAGRATLNWLHEHGFEIGNHTLDHPNLGTVDDTEVQDQIAGLQRLVTSAVPGMRVRSLALPLGVHPDREELAAEGSAGGTDYQYDSVMLVGSNPAPSPWSADFDPVNVPRIRSQGPDGEGSEFGSTAWLDELAANPGRRYTSDGDPERISAPKSVPTEPAPHVGPRVHRY
ncbi:polysaccharide deacetylase family protein [Parasphingorhabdus pacifica]